MFRFCIRTYMVWQMQFKTIKKDLLEKKRNPFSRNHQMNKSQCKTRMALLSFNLYYPVALHTRQHTGNPIGQFFKMLNNLFKITVKFVKPNLCVRCQNTCLTVHKITGHFLTVHTKVAKHFQTVHKSSKSLFNRVHTNNKTLFNRVHKSSKTLSDSAKKVAKHFQRVHKNSRTLSEGAQK